MTRSAKDGKVTKGMGRIIFITGGVRSGKSKFAVELAKRLHKKVVFIATLKPGDKEMKERVRLHQASRPKDWLVIEEPLDLTNTLKKLPQARLIIIDCLTLWISNLLALGLKEENILKRAEDLIKATKDIKSPIIFVSNEVGWGVVPTNKIARRFRDIVGKIHQEIAENSDEVYLMVSGIPIKIKGE